MEKRTFARSIYLLLLMVVLLLGTCRSEPPSDAHRDTQAPADTTSAFSADSTADAEHVVLVLGNSLAAGHGVSKDQAFPAILQKKVDAMGWDVEIVNAGQSGDTSAGGRSRLEWVLERSIDVLVLELGGNDGLQGIDPRVTKNNLAAIIDSTRARYPDVRILLAGMRLPPNMGEDYTRRFAKIYPELAESKNTALVPFLMEGVGGVDSLMQPDGIHPTAAGQRRLAENVWRELKPILAEDCGAEDIALSDTAAMELDALAASADTAGAECAEPQPGS